MRDHLPNKKHGTVTTRVACAVVFLLFCFLWLYFFQADVLAVAQHVLSKGVTRYDRTVGAVVITLVLMLLQLGVFLVTRLARRTHALTYLPSFLLLAFISYTPSAVGRPFTFGFWTWLVPAVLVVWAVVVWLSRQMLPFETDEKVPTGLFSRRIWGNMLIMAVMMLMVAWAGNTNAVFHFRTHAETSLMQNKTDEALRAGRRSLETDVNLTMLRLFALARQGRAGEELFAYPVEGTSADMLPLMRSRFSLLILPVDTIWKAFGARPVYPMTTGFFLRALANDSLEYRMVPDYVLCGHLIDRDLKAFARALPEYYPDTTSLPRFYREALGLSRSTRKHRKLTDKDLGTYTYYYYK